MYIDFRVLVLKIDVIFAGSPKHSDVEKMTGAVRLLRPKLDEIHESAFPILREFKSEVHKLTIVWSSEVA